MRWEEHRGGSMDKEKMSLGQDYERCLYYAKDFRFCSSIDGKAINIFKARSLRLPDL